MNILALLHFTAFLLYVWLIIVVIFRAPKSRLNQAFALFIGCWSLSAFATAFMTAAPDKSSAMLWSKIAGVGFCSFPPFLLRFFLIYTNKERTPGNRIFSLVMFSIPPILYYNVWKGNFVVDLVPAMFHSWQYVWSKSIWPYVFLVYEIISGFAGLWVTFWFGQKTELSHKKKQARIMVVAGIITMIVGVTSDEILARFNISLPPLGSISTLIWAGAIAYAMAKYNLMTVTPATAGEDILSTMIDSLILVNPEGKIIRANNATANLLGYTNKEIIGQPSGILFAEEEEEEEEMPFKGAKLKKLIKEGSIRDYDVTYRAKSGEKIPVSFSGSVMRDKDGNLVGIVGIAQDMREIKRLLEKEKEIVAAEKKRVVELDTAYRELEKSQDASLNIMERSERQRKDLDKAYHELSEKSELLERFNRVAVGQELEMVRLEEEVNTLLAKSGLPRKYETPEKIKK